ncbi:hypothetical protein K437DRAFT_231006 [Tilletiaria anomala UBC 951]|uniref:DNA mismatch repair protein MSH3 n=1 Tax=Tilletiaria anomala (strain ATCC 24038 / CBS 436.72 / UBC 951) TaxID=1037660 RepID=A0A066WHN5_TILAU|nr:uncharacterized protein K437DRAFT_231006 [Tilletiaria anomala UBC 951]KDN53311.1 hypothetical protein K437DRAFT_231006 [Tilletiaria anomala UBC 951]
MPNSNKLRGNLTISSFFSPVRVTGSAGAAANAARSVSAENGSRYYENAVNETFREFGPPTKKLKLDVNSKALAHSRSESNVLLTAADKLSRWRFVEPSCSTHIESLGQNKEPTSDGISEESVDQSFEELQRHEAFRRTLLSGDVLSRNFGYLSETASRPEAYLEWKQDFSASGAGGEVAETEFQRDRANSISDDSDLEEIQQQDKGEGEGLIRFSLLKYSAHSAEDNGRKAKVPADCTKPAFRSEAKGKANEKAVGPSGLPYTPLEEQIIELKRNYPGVLLIVEVGYKLKFFGEDARIASRHLNVACFPDRNFLTAMVPVHRLHVHVRTLISAGYKVGVVRQTETRALKAMSSNASKPFTRKLTGVYTASTWVETLSAGGGMDGDVDANGPGNLANHSLVAIVEKSEDSKNNTEERVTIGIVCVQVSTGQVIWDQFEDTRMRSELETRLAHYSPIEILMPPKGRLSRLTEKIMKYTAGKGTSDGRPIRTERWPEDQILSYNEALNVATETVQTSKQADEAAKSAMLAIILSLPHLALLSFAACVSHLKSFGLDALFQRAFNFSSFASRSTMLLTANTLKNLEIFRNGTDGREKGSLLWLVDRSQTAMGKRLLRKWLGQPLTDMKALRHRLAAVEEVVDKSSQSATLGKALRLLNGLPDLEQGLARLSYGRSSPSEFSKILIALNRVTTEFDFKRASDVPLSSQMLTDGIFSLSEGREVCKQALSAISVVAAREDNKMDLFADPEQFPLLQDVKVLLSVNETEFNEHLKELRIELKRPSLQYTTVADKEYLVEVRKGDANKVPSTWIRINSTTKMVRFHSPRIVALIKQRDQLKETLQLEADNAYKTFVQEFMNTYIPLRNVVASLATLDALNCLARLASLPNFCRPEMVESHAESTGLIELEDFRHPMSEAMHISHYVPNSIKLGETGSKGILLTGSNMGGKSSTVRAIALCVILAQCGAYVPARSARLSLHDSVLTRMGASDDLANGRSTFRVEIEETAEILRAATGRSLVILDELGRGTSTNDGTAVAYAVLRELMSRPIYRCPTTLFITHYFSLGSVASLPDLQGRLVNMYMAYSEQVDEETGRQEIIFLYRLRKGMANSSFGIHCASLAGLPEPLLQEATSQAERFEQEVEQRWKERHHKHLARIAKALWGSPKGQLTEGLNFVLQDVAIASSHRRIHAWAQCKYATYQ